MRGRCLHYNLDRGFGFVIDAMGQEFFVHATELKRIGYAALEIGQEVQFALGKNPRTGRSCATAVELLEPIISPRCQVVEDTVRAFHSTKFMRGGRP